VYVGTRTKKLSASGSLILIRGPWTPLGAPPQIPFRGWACCLPHILDLKTALSSGRPVWVHTPTTEGCRNFKFSANMLPCARYWRLSIFGEKGQRSRSHGPVEFRIDAIRTHDCGRRSALLRWRRLTERLHGTIVGPTGRSDWSVRLDGPTIVSCKRFVRPVGQTVGRIKHVWFRPIADPTVETCGHYVQLVGPTGRSDDQSRYSVGGTCCLRHSYIAVAVIYTSGG